MTRNTRRPGSPLPLLLVAIWSFALPGTGGADSRPIPLDRLREKEAIRLIESAAPADVFSIRGRRVSARSLQEKLVASRRRAEADRRRAAEAARAFHTDDLEILRLRAELAEKAAALQQKEHIDRVLADLQRTLPPDTPEIRRLSEEAARLASAWVFAGPEERRTLEEKIQGISARLVRLGVVLGE